MMKIICQRDPKWGKEKLGESPLTIARWGCTTCCICMITDYFGFYKDPVEIQKYIKYTDNNHPQGPGLIIWQSINIGGLKFEKRLYAQNDTEIQKSLKDPKKAVILEVNKNHWVLVIGKIPFTNIYRIADPLYGDKSTTLRYKSNITGSAHFTKN
jgi:hypothetical protein